jgi:DNA-binding beta-propeller fold protein YncE
MGSFAPPAMNHKTLKELSMRPIACVLSFVVAQQLAAQSAGPYSVTHSYPLGGVGSWDYVVPDPAQHRVFIGRQDRVMVVDATSGKLIGEVTGIHGAHGVAIAERTGHGFATSGDDSSVVMFDLKTLKTLGKMHAAEDADAIIYDAASNRVFTFNGDAHSSTVIDPVAGKTVSNIDLGGKPEYGASAGNGKVYANLTDKGEVVEIDTRALSVTNRWSTAPCKNPVAMAIDLAHQRLFSGCRSGVMAVSDCKAGKVIATTPIGTGVDGAAFDPATSDAFASNADGTLTVIHQDSPDTYRVVQTLKTMTASRNVGLDATAHVLWLPGATFEAVEAPAGSTTRPRPKQVPGTFVLMTVERR